MRARVCIYSIQNAFASQKEAPLARSSKERAREKKKRARAQRQQKASLVVVLSMFASRASLFSSMTRRRENQLISFPTRMIDGVRVSLSLLRQSGAEEEDDEGEAIISKVEIECVNLGGFNETLRDTLDEQPLVVDDDAALQKRRAQ